MTQPPTFGPGKTTLLTAATDPSSRALAQPTRSPIYRPVQVATMAKLPKPEAPAAACTPPTFCPHCVPSNEMAYPLDYPAPPPAPNPTRTVAIIGGGNLGSQIVNEVLRYPSIEKVFFYSKSYDPSALANFLFDVAGDPSNVVPLLALEDVILSEPDVLFLCTGPKVNYLEFEDRRAIRRPLYADAPAAVGPIFSELVRLRYRGLVCMLSNPVGDLALVLHQRYGFPAEQITAFLCGSDRGSRIIARALTTISILGDAAAAQNPALLFEDYPFIQAHAHAPNLGDIVLPVVGGHGAEIPLLELCTVGGRPLSQFGSVFATDAFRNVFAAHLQIAGHKLMRWCTSTGAWYHLSAMVAARACEHIFSGASRENPFRPASHILTWHPEYSAFLVLPAVVNGFPLRSRADFSRLHSFGPKVERQLAELAADQGRFYEANTTVWHQTSLLTDSTRGLRERRSSLHTSRSATTSTTNPIARATQQSE